MHSEDVCSAAAHAAIKAEPYRFVIELEQIGELHVDEETLILANCRACRSTLALQVQS